MMVMSWVHGKAAGRSILGEVMAKLKTETVGVIQWLIKASHLGERGLEAHFSSR